MVYKRNFKIDYCRNTSASPQLYIFISKMLDVRVMIWMIKFLCLRNKSLEFNYQWTRAVTWSILKLDSVGLSVVADQLFVTGIMINGGKWIEKQTASYYRNCVYWVPFYVWLMLRAVLLVGCWIICVLLYLTRGFVFEFKNIILYLYYGIPIMRITDI